METIIIQIKDPKAYKLLKDLEDLEILKVVEKMPASKIDYSKKYASSLPSEVAD